MERVDLLDKRLAALVYMKESLENKARKTEVLVATRGYSDPDEAALYCETRATIRKLMSEIEFSMKDLRDAVDTAYGGDKIPFYSDDMKTKISEAQMVDEILEAAEEMKRCSGIGERIKLLKKRTGLRTGQVSELTGISKGTIQRYQSGKIKNVSMANIERLAKAFDVSPAVMAGWDMI
ncbi:MAG: helix-turn-helix domain-containing protein [Bacteroidales bacterium]|nr:helix-turn-helix domain-containing protein [Bacteroidales bacterium]